MTVIRHSSRPVLSCGAARSHSADHAEGLDPSSKGARLGRARIIECCKMSLNSSSLFLGPLYTKTSDELGHHDDRTQYIVTPDTLPSACSTEDSQWAKSRGEASALVYQQYDSVIT